MAFEMKELRGSLFRNKKKEKDIQPDHTGSIKVNGVEYRLSAWVNTTSQDEKYFSLSLTHPDDMPSKEGQNSGYPEQQKQPSNPVEDMDDDVPF